MPSKLHFPGRNQCRDDSIRDDVWYFSRRLRLRMVWYVWQRSLRSIGECTEAFLLRVRYAGAWMGYGFHEDGFSSGMGVGLRLGGDVPWEVKNAKFSRGVRPVLGWRDYVVRIVIMVLQVWITVLERAMGVKRGK